MFGALSRHAMVGLGMIALASRVSVAQGEGSRTSPLLLLPNFSAVAATNRIGVSSDSIPAGHPPVADTFLGSDKVKHFLMSGFVEAVGFSAMQFAGESRGSSIAVASVVTVATGVGREVHDGRTKGLFSLGDLAWDAMGLGSALLLISHTQR